VKGLTRIGFRVVRVFGGLSDQVFVRVSVCSVGLPAFVFA